MGMNIYMIGILIFTVVLGIKSYKDAKERGQEVFSKENVSKSFKMGMTNMFKIWAISAIVGVSVIVMTCFAIIISR